MKYVFSLTTLSWSKQIRTITFPITLFSQQIIKIKILSNILLIIILSILIFTKTNKVEAATSFLHLKANRLNFTYYEPDYAVVGSGVEFDYYRWGGRFVYHGMINYV